VSEIHDLEERVRALGQLADFWNNKMVLALFLAAVAAIFVVWTTVMALRRTGEKDDAQSELIRVKDRQLAIDLRDKDMKIADAQRAGSEANEKAEKEGFARAQLEAQIQPRQLSATQESTLADAWRGIFNSASIVIVRSYGLDIEATLLGGQILDSLHRGGVEKPIDQRAQYTAGIDASAGIVIRGPLGQDEFLNRVVSALRNTGLAATADSQAYPGGILVLVGIKPLPLQKPAP